MALVAKLLWGSNQFSLSSGVYHVDPAFTPPTVQRAPLLSAGTSANRNAGASEFGWRATNQDFKFTVHIQTVGGSERQVRQAANALNNFLLNAGDDTHPMYLYFKPNGDTLQDPLWGQAAIYYEVAHGSAALGALYGVTGLTGQGTGDCPVTLTLKPWPLGGAQRLANATGSILSDQWGTADSSERGVVACEATTNKMTNPAFGNATWNNAWNAGANITASQNTNPNYLLPQTQSSALLQSNGSTNTYSQTINVGDTNTHQFSALVMRPDGAPVTVADCRIFYGSGLTSTYRNLGDGLYLVQASAAGINSNQVTGLQIFSGRSVYLLAYQCEEASRPTQIRWGDLLGCSWTGTAHASTSSCPLGKLSLPIDDTVLRVAQGSITLTWIAQNANGSANGFLWDARDAGGGFNSLSFQISGNTFVLANSSATATSSAQSWAAGAVLYLTCTWGPTSGLTIYLNGASIGTAAYTPQALGASLWFGQSYLSANLAGGTFTDWRTFPHEMSATEVAADYANNGKAGGATQDVAQRVGAIPTLWTKGGAALVQNCYDGTRSNFAVALGIPGSAPAVTYIDGKLTTTFSVYKSIYLSNWQTPFWIDPANLYVDCSGTVTTVADSGSAVLTLAALGTLTSGPTAVATSARTAVAMAGQQFFCLARINDAGNNLTIAASLGYGSALPGDYATDFIACNSFGSMIMVRTLPLISFPLSQLHPEKISAGIYLGFMLKRTTGSANVLVDYYQFVPSPLARLRATGGDSFIYTSAPAPALFNYGSAGPSYSSTATSADYDVLELAPGVYNTLMSFLGDDSGSGNTVTDTLTYNKVTVQPRYALM